MSGRLRAAVTLTESRRRRRIARLVRKMERLDSRERPRPRRRLNGSRARAVSTVALLLILLLGAWSIDVTGHLGISSRGTRAGAGWPSAPADRQQSRLTPPIEVAAKASSYRFVKTQPGGDDPVTYDSCAPIHVVVNPRRIVDGGSRILTEAVDEIQGATGLVLTVDGLVDERPKKDRAALAADGSAWRPVLVAWSDPAETPELSGGTAGLGGSTAVSRSGRFWFVSGVVSLDGPQLETMLSRQGGREAVRAVIMHELAHVVGLSHVSDPHELMQPKGRVGLTSWGPGDRTGLAALGAGRCVGY